MPSYPVLHQELSGSRKEDWVFVFADIGYVKLPRGRRVRQRHDT